MLHNSNIKLVSTSHAKCLCKKYLNSLTRSHGKMLVVMFVAWHWFFVKCAIFWRKKMPLNRRDSHGYFLSLTTKLTHFLFTMLSVSKGLPRKKECYFFATLFQKLRNISNRVTVRYVNLGIKQPGHDTLKHYNLGVAN